MTHICKTGMSNCVLISPPLKKPFGLVELGWTGYPMCLLFWGGFIYTAVQCFALFNRQQLALCEKLCQLCFRELARKTKNFPELLLLIAGKLHPQWQPQTKVFACVDGHRCAKYSRAEPERTSGQLILP